MSQFENMVLKKIFGPKREVTGGWVLLQSEELHCFVLFMKFYCGDEIK
jgi:hypothetical protein